MSSNNIGHLFCRVMFPIHMTGTWCAVTLGVSYVCDTLSPDSPVIPRRGQVSHDLG